tara:strand:- start:321 stop:740 length:420 start_codon:yes stop_codon:yes gene_type:complete
MRSREELSHMKLSEYLKNNNINISKFAKKIGISRFSLYNYLRNDKTENYRIPKANILERIVKCTDGHVTPLDFYPQNFYRVSSLIPFLDPAFVVEQEIKISRIKKPNKEISISNNRATYKKVLKKHIVITGCETIDGMS